MKKAIIVHGWGGSPDEKLLQWIKTSLEKVGFSVGVPAMPEPETPRIESWITHLARVTPPPDENLFLVGHSVGCQAILRYLETLPEGTRVGGVVLIAPWIELDAETMREEGEEVVEVARPWMETPINFTKIKGMSPWFVVVFSDDDPFVPVSQKELFERELGAEITVKHNRGHFTDSDNVSELSAILDKLTPNA